MLHDFCFFKFFREFVVKPDDRLSEHESDYQRQYQEYRKLDQICPVIHAVHASDGLTHGCHTVCERQLKTHKVYEIENYGSAMAPFYSTLSTVRVYMMFT